MRGWAGLAAAVVCALALAGCTAGGNGGGGGTTTTPTAAANDGLGAAPATPTPTANVTKDVTEANFLTPSKNIGCYLTSDSARCDIIRKDWAPPPKPQDCDLDWGNGISIYEAEEAVFTCAGDTVLGAKEILPYGQSLRSGDVVCDSTNARVSCTNEKSGHGFTLSVQQYDLY